MIALVLMMAVLLVFNFGVVLTQNFTSWNELGDMSTYQKVDSARWIYHLEPDLYKPGHVIYTDGKTLRSTDGRTTSLIVGSEFSNFYSFRDGVGYEVEFSTILGFAQINSTHLVVADLYNHCLRLISRITRKSYSYAAQCGSQNTGLYDGKLSKFAYPAAVIKDKRSGHTSLLVLDRNNNAIRSVDEQGHVTTVIQSDELDRPVAMTWDVMNENIAYISNKNHISRLDLANLTLTRLSGDLAKSGFQDGSFSSALFHQPRSILMLNEKRLLVADQDNSKLRMLDLSDEVVTSVCTGVKGHRDGGPDECQVLYPHSLMMSSEGGVLVGEVGGYIRNLEEEHLRRVLQFTARYTLTDCSLLDNNITLDYMKLLAERNYGIVDRICDTDCSRSTEFSPDITCREGTMFISWPTSPSLGRRVDKIPGDIEMRLTDSLQQRKSGFYMLVKTESSARVLNAEKNSDGALASLSIVNLCANQKTYVPAIQQCV